MLIPCLSLAARPDLKQGKTEGIKNGKKEIMIAAFIVCTILNLEADFRQVKEVSLLKEPQVSTGHVSYNAPDRMCWEYRSPNLCKWELGGQSTAPQVQQLLQFIVNTIAGDYLHDRAEFGVKQEGNVYLLTPKKREMKQLFQSVQITMHKDTNVAECVVLTEKNGDKSTITFYNVEIREE